MKKKILLSFILSAAMLLTACNQNININNDNLSNDKTAVTDATKASEETKREEQQGVKFSHGKTENNKYSSEFFGLNTELGEGWTVFSDDQLARQNKINDMSDETVNTTLDNRGVLYEVMAARENNENFNIVIENLNVTNKGKIITEDKYLKTSLASLKKKLADKYEKSDADIGTTTFMGKEVSCIKAEVTKGEMDAKITIVPVIKDKYVAVITFTAFTTEGVDSMIDVFK